MEMVADVSVIMAVLLNEPERNAIEEVTAMCDLIGPGCIAWEIGNALYGALKRGRIPMKGALEALTQFDLVPIRYIEIDKAAALKVTGQYKIPAYDAYYLECARASGKPLFTLDMQMQEIAKKMKLAVVEVSP